jgi:hypothetical protein
MQEVGTGVNRYDWVLFRHPDFYILSALALAAFFVAFRPTSVPEAHLAGAAVTATEIVDRPTYGFDPGPGFFDGASVTALSPSDAGPQAGARADSNRTYREDIGESFFDMVEGAAPPPDGTGEDPLSEMLTGLFDAPLPGLDFPVARMADLPEDGVLRLRVEDFGAIADATLDNRQAIQDAIDYAHALGGGVIHLGEGTYGVAGDPRSSGAIKLRSNTFLQGAGMGRSVLRLVDGWSGTLVGLVRSPHGQATVNYGLADLTLDGNRTGTSGKVDAYYSGGSPGSPVSDKDAWVLRVEARDFSGNGFDPHERTLRLTIADSVARNNGTDGFVADYIIDGVYRRNIAIGNGRHGFNIVTTSNDFVLEDSVAQGNGGSGLVVQRGDEAIASPHNIRIANVRLTDNAREGALVRLSHDVELSEIVSARNGTYGVRVQGSQNVTLRHSVVLDNSRNGRGLYAAVQIAAEDDAVTDKVYPARDVVVRDNVIGWQNPLRQRSAVHEVKGDVAGTVISNNHFRGYFRRAVQVGSRGTSSRNQNLGWAWIMTALKGAAGGAPTIGDTQDCRDPRIRPNGCAFPDVQDLWPAGLE